jgi:hypothetical protein
MKQIRSSVVLVTTLLIYTVCIVVVIGQTVPCYMCGGDPQATISNPNTVIDLAGIPGIPPGVTSAPCALIFDTLKGGAAVNSSTCDQLLTTPDVVPLLQEPCGCSTFSVFTSAPVPVPVPVPFVAPFLPVPVPVLVPVPVVPVPVVDIPFPTFSPSTATFFPSVSAFPIDDDSFGGGKGMMNMKGGKGGMDGKGGMGDGSMKKMKKSKGMGKMMMSKDKKNGNVDEYITQYDDDTMTETEPVPVQSPLLPPVAVFVPVAVPVVPVEVPVPTTTTTTTTTTTSSTVVEDNVVTTASVSGRKQFRQNAIDYDLVQRIRQHTQNEIDKENAV